MLPEDLVIVAAINKGDEQVFEKLFKQYYQSLCNYACGILTDADEAEDIEQQNMIAIWEKKKPFRINYYYQVYNQDYSIEPRAALKYEIDSRPGSKYRLWITQSASACRCLFCKAT